jgi:urea transporter
MPKLKFPHFIEYCLRGSGQVIFQNHLGAGLCFLMAIFVGSIEVGLGSLSGLILGTLTGVILRPGSSSLINGLYGYNGLLIGAMAANSWPLVIVGSIAGTILQIKTEKVFASFSLPQLTYPFVVVACLLSWMLPKSLVSYPIGFEVFFHHISQIFLIGNSWSGLIILVGLGWSSWRSAAWAAVASVTTFLICHYFNVNIYGFSAVLTAIALGDVFMMKHRGIKAILGILLSLLGQSFLPFTAPFVIVTWIFIKKSQ